MIWLLFGIFVVIAIVSGIMYHFSWGYESESMVLVVLSILLAFAVLIVAFLEIMPRAMKVKYADEQIAYLVEENAKIDNEIMAIVQSFQDYEKEFYNEHKNVPASTMISLYPELKSNELVSRQIEIYVANQKQIKELELLKIRDQYYLFWWSFGN